EGVKPPAWGRSHRFLFLQLIMTAYLVGREVGDTINRNNIRDFPCQVLNTINQLWVSQSKGQFGFSVQKTVYLELGGPANGLYDKKAWHQFCDTVGWLVKDPNPRWNRREWLSYVNVTFNTSARKGHLPTPFMWDWWSQGSWFSDLIAKLGKCDI
ncbi:MAG: GUN4 domain-containing protein, partial [Leptolyngbyaceae cyanobacterium HOT.MB2.61]|nr:GUN4 domain-containing protein [Leptolyngbyaceae cyanobacterium HOT.MB2.61]